MHQKTKFIFFKRFHFCYGSNPLRVEWSGESKWQFDVLIFSLQVVLGDSLSLCS